MAASISVCIRTTTLVSPGCQDDLTELVREQARSLRQGREGSEKENNMDGQGNECPPSPPHFLFSFLFFASLCANVRAWGQPTHPAPRVCER